MSNMTTLVVGIAIGYWLIPWALRFYAVKRG